MLTRKDFLKHAFAGATAISLGGLAPGLSANSYKNVVGANEKIRLGFIGVNARGRAIAECMAKLPECEITYICDVDSRAIAKCQDIVRKITGKTPKGEKDIRKMLLSDEFEGVVIATPDHWHAPAAIMAMQAGKHVYVEKPTSHNPAENDMLIRATSKYNRVVQVGNQRRSWPNVKAAIEELRSGVIGKVKFAKSWYTNNRESIGRGKAAPVPEWLDWELWQGPAPRREYRDNIVHYNWHWFYHWGTGEALNNGTHFVDLMRWGLDVEYPTKVSSVGGRYRYEDDWEWPDTQLISFRFGDTASGSWEGRSCSRQPVDNNGIGVEFYGDTGTLLIGSGNNYKIFDINGKLVKDVKSQEKFEEGNQLNPSQALDVYHFRNWFDGIRKGVRTNSNIVDACISTQLVQYGNIAQLTGQQLEIDPKTGIILNANKDIRKLWSREYEKGWEPKI